MKTTKCKICESNNIGNWLENHHHCKKCGYVWLDEAHCPTPETEKTRYEMHKNSLFDQKYVTMLEDFLLKVGKIKNLRVLDFGCGHTPVLGELMTQKGARVTLHDRYFFPQKTYADKKYDLITLTEVFEHLDKPLEVLRKLKKLLVDNGRLAIMTHLRTGTESEFREWWYRRDMTHVGFLALSGVETLAEKLDLVMEFCDEKKIVILKKVLKTKKKVL